MFGRKEKEKDNQLRCDMCKNIIGGNIIYCKIKRRYLINDNGIWFWGGNVYICGKCLKAIKDNL